MFREYMPETIKFIQMHREDLLQEAEVDLRAHPSDKDQAQWTDRRYDDKGRPVCPFDYAFTANGFDI